MGRHINQGIEGILKQNKELTLMLQNIQERLDSAEKNLSSMEASHKAEVTGLNNKVDSLENKVSSLEDENRMLKEENGMLRDENENLKRILNNNSGNSSIPPSKDENKNKRANTYNGREKTGRKAGGQTGHTGRTLTKAQVEEKIQSGKFERRIVDIGDPSRPYKTKYVIDIEVRTVAQEIRIHEDADGHIRVPDEYRSDVTYGDTLKAVSAYLYSQGVMSNDNIQEFLNALSNGALDLSEGSIYNFISSFAGKCAPDIAKIVSALLKAPVMYTDATQVSLDGGKSYIRNQNTESEVLYSPQADKKVETLRKTGILGIYRGILVHDHETALYHFGSGHGECNVHVTRYNRKNTEESGNPWSREMNEFLCGINRRKKERISQDGTCFSPLELADIRRDYDFIVHKGRHQQKSTEGKKAGEEENALLNRLKKYKKNHLLFAYDFRVDFSNNMSERDLRKCVNREKMAGGFRKDTGQQMYCNIMSIIETLKRRSMGILENMLLILGGKTVFT